MRKTTGVVSTSCVGLLWLLTMLAGCLREAGVTCSDDSVCASGTQCVAVQTVMVCATPAQKDACATLVEQAACTAGDSAGVCRSGVCLPVVCGDGIIDATEACDDGNTLGSDGCSARCDSTEACGNHFVDALLGEQCDDGNNADGDGCQADCRIAACGDGKVDFGEGCDEGQNNNNAPNANCRVDCQPKRCSDGIVDNGELCDDRNLRSGDGCSGDCQSTEFCGNGYVDLANGESCDDGNREENDACRNNCSPASCGDGVVQAVNGEACDNGAANSNAPNAACRTNCQPQRCSDGVLDTGETCDDGNLVSGDNCSGDCLSNETCGNGRVDAVAGEACDDGDAINANSCTNACTIPGCGDGIVQAVNGEVCDDGLANSNAPDAACRLNCQSKRCGDGVLDAAEVCDDGDTESGDGCAGDCSSNETCGNGHVDASAGEACDDGDAINTNGCTNACAIPSCGDGILQVVNGESCDRGAANSNAAGALCRLNCQLPRCGDGVRDGVEVCDDGNLLSSDGCSGDCKSLEVCGNGYVDTLVSVPEECDSGATISNDGCASACKLEVGIWTQQTLTNSANMARYGAAMVFDSTRNKIVMFSGGDSGSYFADTWEWEGFAWRKRFPATTPPARKYHAMVYDSTRRRVVMFGGYNGGSRSDTWEYDGVTWTQSASPPGNSAQVSPAMAFDAARNETVMFTEGSTDPFIGSTVLGETWIYNGTTWTQRVLTVNPPGRIHAAMAYDSFRQRVYMFGGKNVDSNAFLNDLWEWNGTAWTNLTPGTLPPSWPSLSSEIEMVYDSVRNVVVMFGGSEQNETWEYNPTSNEWTQRVSSLNRVSYAMAFDQARGVTVMHGGDALVLRGDTLTFNGAAWTNVTPSGAPGGRRWTQTAYDGLRGKVVMFGGIINGTGGAIVNDTWEWDGVQWAGRVTTPAPGPRMNGMMAYDFKRGKTVLFGGSNVASLNDTWEWDGSKWTQLTPTTSPPARFAGGMVYDRVRGVILLFGGRNAANQQFNDTWELSFNAGVSTWTQLTPATSPPVRTGFAMAYDAKRDRTMLTGGKSGFGFPNDNWEWNGTTWTAVGVGVAAGTEPAMTYDAQRQRVLLFGGGVNSSNNDTWEWVASASQWQRIFPVVVPPPRSGHAMVYDAAHASAIIIGGFQGSPGFGVNDMWSFQFTNFSNTSESCTSTTVDSDGDGLFGCNDPDCWDRCEPQCPPNTTCTGTRSRCGDGVCNIELEDYVLCPADCQP